MSHCMLLLLFHNVFLFLVVLFVLQCIMCRHSDRVHWPPAYTPMSRCMLLLLFRNGFLFLVVLFVLQYLMCHHSGSVRCLLVCTLPCLTVCYCCLNMVLVAYICLIPPLFFLWGLPLHWAVTVEQWLAHVSWRALWVLRAAHHSILPFFSQCGHYQRPADSQECLLFHCSSR